MASIESSPFSVGLRVYTDFDGTVACEDVTDAVLSRFASAEWRVIEAAWRAGEVDAASCMRRQIELIDAPLAELDALLDGIELDPGFSRFVAWCEGEGIPLAVVSDGVDYFARRILARHSFGRIAVFANRLVVDRGRYTLRHPWLAPECRAGSGTCKCAVTARHIAGRARQRSVYVGDGLSDRCVAAGADLLFAKDDLASHCLEHQLRYTSFESFDDVRRELASLGLTRGREERAK